MQKPVIEKPNTTFKELENSGLFAGGPRGVNTPSSLHQTKGLQGFYTWTEMIKQVCRGWAIAKSRTRVGEISFSS